MIANGKAGLLREKDEARNAKDSGEEQPQKASMLTGILIAVVGGLLATGFSYANAVGRPPLHEASQAAGNAEWITAVAVMFPFLSVEAFHGYLFCLGIEQKALMGRF